MANQHQSMPHDLTQAQAIIDWDFLDRIEEAYIRPLEREIAESSPEYLCMDWNQRTIFLLIERNSDKGEALPLMFHDARRGMVTEGVPSPVRYRTDGMAMSGVEISYHAPVYDTTGLNNSNVSAMVAGPPGDEFSIPVAKAPIFGISPRSVNWQRHPHTVSPNDPEDKRGRYEQRDALDPFTREVWTHLTPAYRVALLSQHVQQNVVMDPLDAQKFVLGCKKANPRRFLVTPTTDSHGTINGYTVRIRDTCPTDTLMNDIGNAARQLAYEQMDLDTRLGPNLSAQADGTIEEHPLIERQQGNGKRRNNPRTEAMVAYVNRLKRNGTKVGRGGLSWEAVRADLERDEGIVYENAESLRKAYASASRRYARKGSING